MAGLEIQGIKKGFGQQQILRGIDLSIADGEFVVFVGPSGCGKSTLLRTICGLENSDEGAVLIGGKDMTDVAPAARGIAMVFQSYALYPHMTVYDNMAFALKLAGLPQDEIHSKVTQAAAILRIEPLLQRKPKELSGGQRQRVAIGRAIVRQPQVFLFDEPLSNLDAALRVQMRIELKNLHRTLRSTMIYVTHDQVEAMTLADRIVVLRGGVVEQVGAPLDLYQRPANLFVAGFLGSPAMNFVGGTVEQLAPAMMSVRLAGGALVQVVLRAGLAVGDRITLGVRAEHMALEAADGDGIAVTVLAAELLGDASYVYLTLDGGATQFIARTDPEVRWQNGQLAVVRVDPVRWHMFDSDGLAI
ncbi:MULTISPECIES: ABC transporter ATP-binding protein [unclassified Duganella]|uniref:ABC transporter ATP-binding protein n=1 Tax=unclassified Duganella TaxID=2636909 RepID=UPI000E3448C5|nr:MULTISPECIES: sn-glycerol-3-phosphate ABC transporter ATP-binding protein UgpC [unclassified Duganella]RFP18340.1 sn-glycerol-3-phosphate ABC transporter ATP-binding protein UgpC [Duganella sp. BJB475]RFP35005.1 sn-glycerol-3-phosphate ABC transporter ATP-binding protein UgpC [Duganella sp. BJB476]